MNLRTTLLSLALAMSCAATPPQAANEAEALYKKMEAALKATPLKFKFTSSVEHPSTPVVQMKGSLSVEEGNKAVLEVEGKVGVRTYTLKLTSDGKEISIARSEAPPPPDLRPLPPPAVVAVPKSPGANLASAAARGGAWLVQDYFDGEYRAAADRYFKGMQGMTVPPPKNETDVAEWHLLKNFTMGKKDKSGQAVQYEMTRAGDALGIYTAVTV